MFRGFSRSNRPNSQGAAGQRRSSEAKNELAITPPKRIIRALYAYKAQHNDELSFEKDAFFYVNEETSGEWYMAFDPLKNVKGIVPKGYFEVIQRQDQQLVNVSQARKAHSRTASQASSARHISHQQHQPKGSDVSNAPSFGGPSSVGSVGMPLGAAPLHGSGPEIITRGSHSQQASVSSQNSRRGSLLTLYGLVLYDFQAERNDELTVTAGESIVIVAQSTDEWFVAKPIGRLGGPGLVPVSYVELREVGTDRKLDDVNDAIRRSNLPQVEEWKRRLAEYKASSIPLGRPGEQGEGNGSGHSHGHSRSASAAFSARSDKSGRSNHSHLSKPHHNGKDMGSASGSNGSHTGTSAGSHSGTSSSGSHASGVNGRPYVVSASVDRFAVNGGRYWYFVKVQLSDGIHRNLCRFYQDFYDFQIKLLEQFPEEAGRTGLTRTLPFMPGPLTLVTHTVSSQRRANLDDYVSDLIRMPPHISQSPIVLDLFSVRPGDVESSEATQQLPQPPVSDEHYSGDMPESQADAASASYRAVHEDNGDIATEKFHHSPQREETDMEMKTQEQLQKLNLQHQQGQPAQSQGQPAQYGQPVHQQNHSGQYPPVPMAYQVPTGQAVSMAQSGPLARHGQQSKQPMHQQYAQPTQALHTQAMQQGPVHGQPQQVYYGQGGPQHVPQHAPPQGPPGNPQQFHSQPAQAYSQTSPTYQPYQQPTQPYQQPRQPAQIYGASNADGSSTSVGRSDIKLDQPTLKIKVFAAENVIAIRIPVETPFDTIYEKIGARLGVPQPQLYGNGSFVGNPIDNAAAFARELNGGTKMSLHLKP